jgi:hypothetical protein
MAQARTATDPNVRAAMAVISVDESRHAELGWQIDAWVRATYPALRERLDAAKAAAISQLEQSLQSQTGSERLGLPDRDTALALFRQVRQRLWS